MKVLLLVNNDPNEFESDIQKHLDRLGKDDMVTQIDIQYQTAFQGGYSVTHSALISCKELTAKNGTLVAK